MHRIHPEKKLYESEKKLYESDRKIYESAILDDNSIVESKNTRNDKDSGDESAFKSLSLTSAPTDVSSEQKRNLMSVRRSTTPMEIESNDSIFSNVVENLKRTIPTALSYDFSLSWFVIGLMISHYGEEEAAPATTTMIAAIGYFLYASVLASLSALGNFYGELQANEKRLAEIEEQTNYMQDMEHNLVTNKILALKRKISTTPRNAMLIGSLTTPVLLCMEFSSSILKELGQTDTVAESAQSLLRAYGPFLITVPPRFAVEFLLLSAQKQRMAMLIADAVLLVTIGLQYSLTFQTPLGLEGLGLASGFGTALTFVSFMLYAIKYFSDIPFIRNMFEWEVEDKKQVIDFFKQGCWNVFTMVSDVSVSFAISLFAGLLSKDDLELQNLAIQLLNINLLITAATSTTTLIAASTKRGQAKSGAGSYDSIIPTVQGGIIANCVLLSPMCIFACAAPSKFSSAVGASIDEIDARNLLIFTSVYSFADSMRYNLLLSMRAIDDIKLPTLISSGALWTGVGASYLLSHFTRLGVLGLPIGLTAGAVTATMYSIVRLKFSIQQAKEKDLNPNTPQDTQNRYRLFACTIQAICPTKVYQKLCDTNETDREKCLIM